MSTSDGPVGAAAQVARLLALVPYALTRREVPLEEAARDLGVTPRQVVADLKVLMYCGWPGYLPGDLIEVDLDALQGDGVVRVTNADSRSVRRATMRAEVLDRALAKLGAAAEDGAAAAGQVELHLDAGAREVNRRRGALAQALRAGHQVALTYYVPARDERTERTVDPLGLVTTQGMTYLDGWCHLVADRRLFRLDRIETLTELASPVAPHPDLAPRDLSAGLFQPSSDHPVATVRLSPPARWVAEYYPVRSVRETDDGGLEVELEVADPRWLLRLLLRLAPEATVVGPPAYAEQLTAALQRTHGLYHHHDVA